MVKLDVTVKLDVHSNLWRRGHFVVLGWKRAIRASGQSLPRTLQLPLLLPPASLRGALGLPAVVIPWQGRIPPLLLYDNDDEPTPSDVPPLSPGLGGTGGLAT